AVCKSAGLHDPIYAAAPRERPPLLLPSEVERGRQIYGTQPRNRPQHLAGELTIGIYAINPATQRSKWMAIDADYKTALEDLIKVQRQLRDDGIAAALEKSKRGGHLWMFFEQPVVARHARTYIYHVAQGLGVQVK